MLLLILYYMPFLLQEILLMFDITIFICIIYNIYIDNIN